MVAREVGRRQRQRKDNIFSSEPHKFLMFPKAQFDGFKKDDYFKRFFFYFIFKQKTPEPWKLS